MKRIKTITCAIVAVIFIASLPISCSKEDNGKSSVMSIKIDGALGELDQLSDTKYKISTPVRLKWSNNDKVYAFDAMKCLGELNVTIEDDKDYYAVLSGNDLLTPETEAITLVHAPGFSAAKGERIVEGKLVFNLSQQNGTFSKVPFVAYATISCKQGQTQIKGLKANFEFATSLIRLNCSGLEANKDITQGLLRGASNECVLKITGEGASLQAGRIGNIYLTVEDMTADEKGTNILYAALAKTDNVSVSYAEATQNLKNYECLIPINTAWAERTAYNTICSMKRILNFTVGTNPEGGKRTVNFAPGNLYCTRSGSESNLSYSFAFEANQFDFRSNGDFNDDAAVIDGILCSTPDNTSGHFLWLSGTCEAPVNEKASYGAFSTIDEEKVKGGTDDIIEFGKALGEDSAWRLLTHDEWKYLIKDREVNGGTGYGNTCVWATVSTGVTENTVNGLIIFHDKYNGATSGLTSIPEGCAFLPAAGMRGQATITDTGKKGYYWSSSSAGNILNQAYSCDFYESDAVACTNARSNGQSIRLVTDRIND